MVGSDKEGDASGEVSGDPMALWEGDLACGTTMVCALSYIGKGLWISPLGFHMQEYCSCDMTLLGEVLYLPSELAGDRGSLGMVTSNRGHWLGATGYASKDMGWGDGT